MIIKIIKHNFFYNGGSQGVSYAIQIDGKRWLVYYTLDELKHFIDGTGLSLESETKV